MKREKRARAKTVLFALRDEKNRDPQKERILFGVEYRRFVSLGGGIAEDA